jgi:hypothetical protein
VCLFAVDKLCQKYYSKRETAEKHLAELVRIATTGMFKIEKADAIQTYISKNGLDKLTKSNQQ